MMAKSKGFSRRIYTYIRGGGCCCQLETKVNNESCVLQLTRRE